MTYSEIYHHGILGQKWGVRRYQNADGTLTSAGKKRYADKIINTAKDKASSLSKTVKNKTSSPLGKELISTAKSAAKGAAIGYVTGLAIKKVVTVATSKNVADGMTYIGYHIIDI